MGMGDFAESMAPIGQAALSLLSPVTILLAYTLAGCLLWGWMDHRRKKARIAENECLIELYEQCTRRGLHFNEYSTIDGLRYKIAAYDHTHHRQESRAS